VIPVVPKPKQVGPVQWLGLHHQYLNDGEMEVIVSLLHSINAESMIEFGCRDGRTAKVLLHNVPSLKRYVGVDVPPSYNPSLPHQRNEMVSDPGHLAQDDPRFQLVISARGSLDLDPEVGKYDVVFIDGDHSEYVVMSDSMLALTVVKVGGVIIWHDYFNGAVDVQTVVNMLHKDGWPVTSVEGTWLAYLVR